MLKHNARNPLQDGLDPAAVDAAIYGGGQGSLSDLEGRMVARPTPIMEIGADVRQPRRAIPASVRLYWDGNPATVPSLLRQWEQVAAGAAGKALDVASLLVSDGEGLDVEALPPVAAELAALARLAASIDQDGLINPITVIELGGRLLIESGERRWLAYHLLRLYQGERWDKIPATRSDGRDSVWRQATENTARRALNAIGMARQLALLIMAARDAVEAEGLSTYQAYEEIVRDCDRAFYAQVADGNRHRIPKGYAEKIQASMGLSESQLAQYRTLLRLTDDEAINDALWLRADVENWPEKWLRQIRTFTQVKVSAVIERPEWTIDDLMALENEKPALVTGAPKPAPDGIQPAHWLGQWVQADTGVTGVAISVQGNWIVIRTPSGGQRTFEARTLTRIDPPQPEPRRAPPAAESKVESEPNRLPDVRSGAWVYLTDRGEHGEFQGYERGADGLTWARVDVDGLSRQVAPLSMVLVEPPQAAPPATDHVIASDKLVSARPIVERGSPEFYALEGLKHLAQDLSAGEAVAVCDRLLRMTEQEAAALPGVAVRMDEWYSAVQVFMEDLLNDVINPLLQRIQDMNERSEQDG